MRSNYIMALSVDFRKTVTVVYSQLEFSNWAQYHRCAVRHIIFKIYTPVNIESD